MFAEGYLKLYRSILEWEWYDDIPTTRLFIHLLLTVNIKDDFWHGIPIPKGARIASIEILSREAGLTKKQIRGSVGKLERAGCVARSVHGRNTVISIVNWDKYQEKGQGQGHRNGTIQGTSGAKSGQDEGNRIRKKEEKKEKNKEYIYSPYGEIVEYLNKKTGKRYRENNAKTKSLIQARLKEGFTAEDFKRVIDLKVREWGKVPQTSGEKDMRPYLRPETLFGTKFEGYLNQIPTIKEKPEEKDCDGPW